MKERAYTKLKENLKVNKTIRRPCRINIALFFHAQESMQNSIVLDKVVKTRPFMVFEVRNE